MKWIAMLACLGLVAQSHPALADVPQTMSYQGVLTTNAGNIVPDGPYDLTFRIYDVSGGGSALWTESHLQVAVSKGTFSVILGASPNPGPVVLSLPFDRPYWLGITVSPGPEISPRTRLASSPYSLNARSLFLPFSGSASVADGAAIRVTNTTTEVDPSKKQFALHGVISNAAAGFNSVAVRGENLGTGTSSGYGVYGSHTGAGTAVYGQSAGGYGVYGVSTSLSGVLAVSSQGMGLEALSAQNTAIYGQSGSLQPNAIAIHGRLHQAGSASGSIAVRAENNGTGGGGYGLFGTYTGNGWGVTGECASGIGVEGRALTGSGVVGLSSDGFGVQGVSFSGRGVYGASTTGFAGYFSGNVHVNGNLTKNGGAFKIDHPLDPANRYLSHSFVESPDMMNVYNGNVILDDQGEAPVVMPDWFQALNQDFRYQLTPIGAPGPNLYVSSEMKDNQFRIAGGSPGLKVSWQVTGIRHDAFANAHRIQVEEDKALADRGRYLDPLVHGQPLEKGIGRVQPPVTIEPEHSALAKSAPVAR